VASGRVGAALTAGWRQLGKSEREEQAAPGREVAASLLNAEEVVARPELGPCVAPELVADVANGGHGEGQQVQAHQNGREILFPVSEAVLKAVALGLEDVERLILDLPPGPAAGGEFDDGVGADGQIGDKAVRRFGQLG
jgi:hypothetical protein